MKNRISMLSVLLCVVLASASQSVGQAPQAAPQTSAAMTSESGRAFIQQFCMGCHNDTGKAGGLALSELNLDAVDQHAEIAEKVIRKLRAGMMPPPGAPRRPDPQAAADMVSWLENKIDAAATDSRPGRVAMRRLNRREYAYVIRDLLGITVDVGKLLPLDDRKGNFDNNAAGLQVSPAFIDQYVSAAREIAREAVGDAEAPPVTTTYGDVENMVISLPPRGAPGTGRQQHHLEGMPFGTRGGMSVKHDFPVDGDYELTIGDMALAREVPRMEFENTVITLLDGAEFYRTTIGGNADHKAIDQK